MCDMKKIIILSDTHKNLELLRAVSPRFDECDYVVHLGDYVSDMTEYKEKLGGKLHMVRGNGDFTLAVPDEKVLEIDGVKLFLTHGHRYNVKATRVNVGFEAYGKSCSAALFGHTHRAEITEFEGIKLINPGSFHRSPSGVFSYCYMLIYGGKCYPRIVELNGGAK